MSESTQHKLDRIRPPRVQITYDVEIGDAIQKKELPFVGGIMADLSGMPETPLPKIKDRKFTEIDRDNFNDIMAATNPRLVFQVENKLKNDGSKINLELKFSHMDDFDPVAVVKQVKPLAKLYEARQRLSDLLTKLDGNDDLDQLLQDIVSNTEHLQTLKKLSGPNGGSAAQAAAAPNTPEGEAAPSQEPKEE